MVPAGGRSHHLGEPALVNRLGRGIVLDLRISLQPRSTNFFEGSPDKPRNMEGNQKPPD